MKKILTCLFGLFLFGCAPSNADVKKPNERTLIKTDKVDIRGRDAGLPENMRRASMVQFLDGTTNRICYDFVRDLDRMLRKNLEVLGVVLVASNEFPESFISGRVEGFEIYSSRRITNSSDGLLYTVYAYYSVFDSNGSVFLSNKLVKEDILVLDTNRYYSNIVVRQLNENLAKHLSESIFYGWQLDYSKTSLKVFTLGGSNESSTGANW